MVLKSLVEITSFESVAFLIYGSIPPLPFLGGVVRESGKYSIYVYYIDCLLF